MPGKRPQLPPWVPYDALHENILSSAQRNIETDA